MKWAETKAERKHTEKVVSFESVWNPSHHAKNTKLAYAIIMRFTIPPLQVQ